MLKKSLAVVCLALVGCSSFDTADGSTNGTGDAGADGFAPVTGEVGPSLYVGVDPTTATVLAGEAIEVNVSLVRRGGLTGPVALKVEGANAGATAGGVTLGENETTAKLRIETLAGAKHGPATLKVTATNDATKIYATTDIALTVRGAAGTVDNSFGQDGKVTLSNQQVSSLRPTPDGKLFAVGRVTGDRGFVVKMDGDGALDASFGGGSVETPFSVKNTDVLPYADGSILVVGARMMNPVYGPNARAGTAVMRITSKGSYEQAFDSDPSLPGRHTLGTDGSEPRAVVLGSRLYATVGTDLVKVDDRGSPSLDFGANGKVNVGSGFFVERMTNLAMVPMTINYTISTIAASNGVVTPVYTDPGPSFAPGYMTSSPDGKLVGPSFTDLVRTAADMKSLDPSFGIGGKYKFDTHPNEPLKYATYIDGALFTAGWVGTSACISRRLDNGSPDPGFAGGLAKIGAASGNASVLLTKQADGRLLFVVNELNEATIYRVWQ